MKVVIAIKDCMPQLIENNDNVEIVIMDYDAPATASEGMIQHDDLDNEVVKYYL